MDTYLPVFHPCILSVVSEQKHDFRKVKDLSDNPVFSAQKHFCYVIEFITIKNRYRPIISKYFKITENPSIELKHQSAYLICFL